MSSHSKHYRALLIAVLLQVIKDWQKQQHRNMVVAFVASNVLHYSWDNLTVDTTDLPQVRRVREPILNGTPTISRMAHNAKGASP